MGVLTDSRWKIVIDRLDTKGVSIRMGTINHVKPFDRINKSLSVCPSGCG